MTDILTTLLAIGPPEGIEPLVAVKWVILWTVVLGGAVYVSLYWPQWLPLDDEPTHPH